jgi:hypothetical protein
MNNNPGKEIAMSNPNHNHEDALYGAIQELTSAMSALMMPAKPMEGVSPDDDGFLADNDATARHSYEHMKAAMSNLVQLINRR